MAVTQGELITALTTFLSTNPVRLAMRSGLASELDLADLIVGEIALATDTLQVWICTSLGTVVPLTGLTILGYYANAGALATAHPTGTAGQIYAVGSAPTHMYTWGGAAWVDLGAMNDTSVFATLASPTFTGTVTLPSTTSFTAMPYVGTAPIVASGSNSNGAYVKYSDGTMLWHITKTIDYGSNVATATFSLDFSVAFYAAPSAISFVLNAYEEGVNTGVAVAAGTGDTTTTTFTGGFYRIAGSMRQVKASFFAIGRWKA